MFSFPIETEMAATIAKLYQVPGRLGDTSSLSPGLLLSVHN